MNILEYLGGLFKRQPLTRERLEKHRAEIRKRMTETQLNLDMEKRSGRAGGMNAMKYERELAYWTRLLEKLNEAEIVE